MLSHPRRRILEALFEAPDEGWPLVRVARSVRLAHPTVLAHLRRLKEEGLVIAREGGEWGHGSRYSATAATHHLWCDPARGVLADWTSRGPIDWRFPLVSRVPDAPAKKFLYEWLDRAQARGLLPSYRSRFEPQHPPPPAVHIVVFGSCARGDAGPKSDLDLLILGDLARRAGRPLVDLAHDVGLTAGRAPDARVLDDRAWKNATLSFRRSVQTQGKTVFSNDAAARPVEQTTGVALGRA